MKFSVKASGIPHNDWEGMRNFLIELGEAVDKLMEKEQGKQDQEGSDDDS